MSWKPTLVLCIMSWCLFWLVSLVLTFSAKAAYVETSKGQFLEPSLQNQAAMDLARSASNLNGFLFGLLLLFNLTLVGVMAVRYVKQYVNRKIDSIPE